MRCDRRRRRKKKKTFLLFLFPSSSSLCLCLAMLPFVFCQLYRQRVTSISTHEKPPYTGSKPQPTDDFRRRRKFLLVSLNKLSGCLYEANRLLLVLLIALIASLDRERKRCHSYMGEEGCQIIFAHFKRWWEKKISQPFLLLPSGINTCIVVREKRVLSERRRRRRTRGVLFLTINNGGGFFLNIFLLCVSSDLGSKPCFPFGKQ